MAGKNGLGVQLGFRGLTIAPTDPLSKPPKRDRLAAGCRGELRCRLCLDAYQRHPLKISPVVACGLEAREGELCRDIFAGEIAAARAYAASFQEIVGQEANMRPNAG